MKEGTKVKVTACFTGHEFDIGEVVMRKYLEEDHSEMCLGFVDDKGSSWYMSPEEYEVCDKVYECGWISVEDSLPGYPKTVLVAYESDSDGEPCLDTGFAILHPDGVWRGAGVFYRIGQNRKFEIRECVKSVTHWMPLPEPPK